MEARGAAWGVDFMHRNSTLPKPAAPGSNPAPERRSADRLRKGRSPRTGRGDEETDMSDERKYLSTREAAEYLGLSARTLDRYRVSGEGPVFHRFGGRVRYTRGDLDAWAKARRRASTADDGSVLAGEPA